MSIVYSDRLYEASWGKDKLNKLRLYASDLLENGKRPLLPAQSFYSNWDDSAKDLANMTSKILKYLKFKPLLELHVDFSKEIDSPGLFILKDSKTKILVNSKYKNNSTACAAILAHEICHLVLNSQGIRENDVYENELLTDYATVYLGMGVLVLNGKYISKKIEGKSLLNSILGFLAIFFTGMGFISNPITTTENSFGYWGINQYYTIFLGYTLINNINLDIFSPYIKEGIQYSGI